MTLVLDSAGNIKQSGSGGSGAPTDASYVTLGTDATLTDERVLTAGEGIDLTDGGAGSTITVSGEDASAVNKGIASFDSTDFSVSSGDVTIQAERVQDIAGAMVIGNTETGITVTYQDGDGTVDFVVSDTTVAGDSGSTGMTPGDTLTIAGGTNATTAMSGDTLTVNVDDAFLSNSGDTGTGVYDFGGATSLEIPNGATPTVNADGEIAVDTTVTDFSHGIVKYYSGEEAGVVAMPIAEFTSPTDGHVVSYNATNDEFELAEAAGGGGKVLQMVTASSNSTFATTTAFPGDDTIPQITEGTEVLTAAITPVSATSTLYIHFHTWTDSTTTALGGVGLFVDATADALCAYGIGTTGGGIPYQASLLHNVASGSTSARTYRIRMGPESGTMYINKEGNTDRYSTVALIQMSIIEVEA